MSFPKCGLPFFCFNKIDGDVKHLNSLLIFNKQESGQIWTNISGNFENSLDQYYSLLNVSIVILLNYVYEIILNGTNYISFFYKILKRKNLLEFRILLENFYNCYRIYDLSILKHIIFFFCLFYTFISVVIDNAIFFTEAIQRLYIFPNE